MRVTFVLGWGLCDATPGLGQQRMRAAEEVDGAEQLDAPEARRHADVGAPSLEHAPHLDVEARPRAAASCLHLSPHQHASGTSLDTTAPAAMFMATVLGVGALIKQQR